MMSRFDVNILRAAVNLGPSSWCQHLINRGNLSEFSNSGRWAVQKCTVSAIYSPGEQLIWNEGIMVKKDYLSRRSKVEPVDIPTKMELKSIRALLCHVSNTAALSVSTEDNVNRGLLLQGSDFSSEVSRGDLELVFETANSEEKLRAAAALRARSFYTYPEGRSSDAIKSHQKMKANDIWEMLTCNVRGLEESFKNMVCVVALSSPLAIVEAGMDLLSSCQVPVCDAEDHLLVGTLDLHQGATLPGELTGNYPQGPKAANCRGYVSNVCVAKEARGRGVGTFLMLQAKSIAEHWGITDLYVHVVVDNISAQRLYAQAGFRYEKEESVSEARNLCRPRRLLLRAQVGSEARSQLAIVV